MQNKKLYYDCNGENPLTGDVLKAMILQSDFLTAWWLVTVYIFKFKVTKYHRKLMKFQHENQYSLLLSGRGLGKSSVCSTSYVMTKILRNPDIRICIITATFTQSEDFVRELKQYFEDEAICWELFGNIRGDVWKTTKFSLKRKQPFKEGTVNCASMSTSSNCISKHYNLILLDDSIIFDNCETVHKRERFMRFIENTVYPTLIEEDECGKGEIHIIGTHYHPNDYYSVLNERYLEDNNTKFKVLKVPSLVMKDGKEKSICPAIKSTKYLVKERANMDINSWNMQYMAKVSKSNSLYFKEEYFQFFHNYRVENDGTVLVKVPVLKIDKKNNEYFDYEYREVRVFMGVDLAISKSKTADRFCISVIGVDKYKNVYLLDIYADKLTFSEQQEAIKKYYNKWYMTIRIGIDSTSYQQAMASELMRLTDLPVKPMKLSKNKETRISVFSAKWENLQVYLYKDKGGKKVNDLNILIDECYAFGGGTEHDDTIDSFCLAWELYIMNYDDEVEFDFEAFANAFS